MALKNQNDAEKDYEYPAWAPLNCPHENSDIYFKVMTLLEIYYFEELKGNISSDEEVDFLADVFCRTLDEKIRTKYEEEVKKCKPCIFDGCWELSIWEALVDLCER